MDICALECIETDTRVQYNPHLSFFRGAGFEHKVTDVKWRMDNTSTFAFIIYCEYNVWNVSSDLTYQPHFIGLLAGCLFSVVHVVRYL